MTELFYCWQCKHMMTTDDGENICTKLEDYTDIGDDACKYFEINPFINDLKK